MLPTAQRSRRSLKQLVMVGLMALALPTTGCDMAAIGKLMAALGPMLSALSGLAKAPAGAAVTPGAAGTTPASPGVVTSNPAGSPTITAAQAPRPNPFVATPASNDSLARLLPSSR